MHWRSGSLVARRPSCGKSRSPDGRTGIRVQLSWRDAANQLGHPSQDLRTAAEMAAASLARHVLPNPINVNTRHRTQGISEIVAWVVERTLQGSNMSGEMTLGALTTSESLSCEQPRRNRVMGKKQTPLMTSVHTGWSDDALFVEAVESPVIVAPSVISPDMLLPCKVRSLYYATISDIPCLK